MKCPYTGGICPKSPGSRNCRSCRGAAFNQDGAPYQDGASYQAGAFRQEGASERPGAQSQSFRGCQSSRRPQVQPKPLALPSDIVYHYDGGLAGFFCCVYESVYFRELPTAILPDKEAQPTLFQVKSIITDQDKAARVRSSIPAKISKDALALVENVFLSCLQQKELLILRFLLLAYREGGKVLRMLGHPDVAPLLKAEKHLMGEAHLLKGFVRFSDYEGVLAASITPKNFVLPYIAGHFCARFSQEDFLIYDKTHKAALICQKGRRRIVPLDALPFPEADETETRYRELWKKFYHTVAIEARYNPRCRMTHMPKRYWENMTEMQELL